MYCMYFFNSVSVIDLSWVHWNKGQKNDSTVLWDTQEFVIVSGDVIILFPFFIKFKHNNNAGMFVSTMWTFLCLIL